MDFWNEPDHGEFLYVINDSLVNMIILTTNVNNIILLMQLPRINFNLFIFFVNYVV